MTVLRIVITPVFIICLFYDHPYSRLCALILFIVASITDAYDGYFARKYDQITAEGRFLDPLADKILISSAFISFAVMGVVEYWMVSLIIFRDLFVTGLRMVMERNGVSLITTNIAKAKTGIQISIIIFILLILGLQVFPYELFKIFIELTLRFNVIYYMTLTVTFFTLWTGISYLYNNRTLLKKITS